MIKLARFGNFPNDKNWLYSIQNGLYLNQGKSVEEFHPTYPPPFGKSGGLWWRHTREGFSSSNVELVAAVKILVRDERRKIFSGFFEGKPFFLEYFFIRKCQAIQHIILHDFAGKEISEVQVSQITL